MVQKTFEVISEFDPKKKYDVSIENREAKVLLVLKKGDKTSQKEFIDKHLDEFSLNNKKIAYHSNQQLVYRSFKLGKELGLLVEVLSKEMSFDEFLKLESVQYCKQSLRGSKFKNLSPGKTSFNSTQRTYFYQLWDFSKWLKGRKFEYDEFYQQDENNFKRKIVKVTLKHLEHLLTLCEKSRNPKPFRKIIKQYLTDERHAGKKLNTINVTISSIKAYFKHNESDLEFYFNPKINHDSGDDEKDFPIFTLEDLFKILSEGHPSITQKAVILCKFQRGLDTSTLVDRFNFQAWEQMVEYFGTEVYQKWNLDKCPVPIKLVRIKKDFMHTGFLDRDAISSIQTYLDFRFKKTGKPMQEGEPMFLNITNDPITPSWVRRSFSKLANSAGIQRKLKGYSLRTRYEKDSHELRDLLKSTLLASGTRYEVADHVIGHMPKDSYDKQNKLYPETSRVEYMKASGKLNIFTNMSRYLEGSSELEVLRDQNQKLKEEVGEIKEDLAMVMKHHSISKKHRRKK